MVMLLRPWAGSPSERVPVSTLACLFLSCFSCWRMPCTSEGFAHGCRPAGSRTLTLLVSVTQVGHNSCVKITFGTFTLVESFRVSIFLPALV